MGGNITSLFIAPWKPYKPLSKDGWIKPTLAVGGINAKLHYEITKGITPHSTRYASISKARLHVPRETRQKAGGGAAYIHSQKQ